LEKCMSNSIAFLDHFINLKNVLVLLKIFLNTIYIK